jgi:coproporphyrinogen III oxidase-like Fe-S oxidoreductase
VLAGRGYTQYEVSAYARPHCQCRHNLNYWRFGDYLGIGAGAHGKITDVATGTILRLWKPKQPRTYIQSAGQPAGVAGNDILAPADAAFEFMLNALRLNGGFEASLFSDRTGMGLDAIAGPLQAALDQGLLERRDETYAPTATGRRFLNNLMELFLPEDHCGGRRNRG